MILLNLLLNFNSLIMNIKFIIIIILVTVIIKFHFNNRLVTKKKIHNNLLKIGKTLSKSSGKPIKLILFRLLNMPDLALLNLDLIKKIKSLKKIEQTYFFIFIFFSFIY